MCLLKLFHLVVMVKIPSSVAFSCLCDALFCVWVWPIKYHLRFHWRFSLFVVKRTANSKLTAGLQCHLLTVILGCSIPLSKSLFCSHPVIRHCEHKAMSSEMSDYCVMNGRFEEKRKLVSQCWSTWWCLWKVDSLCIRWSNIIHFIHENWISWII